MRLDLELGIDDGDPEWQLFATIQHTLVAPDGRIILADRRRNQVYVIAADGTLLTKVGGTGEGPGEFRSIWWLHWADRGREFWVQDINLLRFNCYSIDGEFLRSQHYGRQEGLYDSFIALGDSRFIALTAGEMSENISSRYSLITDKMKKIRDFIEVPPQQVWHDVKLGGWGYIPYTAMDGVGVFPDGRIFSYHPYQPRITIYSPEGDPVLHIDHDWEFPRVTAEEKERFRSTFRDHPGNEKFRHWATDTPIPDRHAAFDFVVADDRDRIWVQRTSPERSEDGIPDHVFDIFDSNGIWLGIQELPHQPLHILDGCVYFIYQAESGAPRFARYVITIRSL